MSSQSMPRDYYEVLGVARDAGEADVKKAFRRLARELHPDVNPDDPQAEQRFKEAAEAYEVLSDPERRATYDRYGHEGVRQRGYAPNFEGFGSISDIFEAFFGSSAGGGGGLGDIFGSAFGGGVGGRGGPVQGGDVAAAVELDLAQAARGESVEVSYEVVARCERCHGNGAEPGTPIETCSRCGGAGRLQAVSRTPFGQVMRAVACDVCHGEGKVAQQPCRECRGRGRTARETTLRVDVPAGIADGQRVRLSGHGHAGDHGGPPGDLYVEVHVRPDERFVRDGDDLVTVLDVPAPLAALGTTLEAPTLDEPEQVEIEPGTQPGDVIVLRGRGIPPVRGRGRRGDLRAVVNVIVPRRLDEQQRELLRRVADSLGEEHLRAEDEGVLSRLKRALGGS